MTYNEICSAYARIEDLDVDEIQDLLDETIDGDGPIIRGLFARSISFNATAKGAMEHVTSKHKLQRVCRQCLNNYNSEIRQMVDSHRKQASCILDILVLVAPAVAQQVAGMTAMTIVGTLTIMIKQSLLS